MKHWKAGDLSVEPWLPKRSWAFDNGAIVIGMPILGYSNTTYSVRTDKPTRPATDAELLELRLLGAIIPVNVKEE